MEDKIIEIPIAKVKSPEKGAHLRKGEGFSLSEIKAAGKTVQLLKKLNIKIDSYRKSAHVHNIEELKKLKAPAEKKKKRNYTPKEKVIKKTPFKGVKEDKKPIAKEEPEKEKKVVGR